MLKKLFSAASRTSKKYQQQFSAGDSEQRLRVLQELQEAITTGELAEIGPELKLLLSSALAREHNTELRGALLPWIDDPESDQPGDDDIGPHSPDIEIDDLVDENDESGHAILSGLVCLLVFLSRRLHALAMRIQ